MCTSKTVTCCLFIYVNVKKNVRHDENASKDFKSIYLCINKNKYLLIEQVWKEDFNLKHWHHFGFEDFIKM